MTPEQKMQEEDLMDPHIHARNHMVLHHIKRAIRMAQDPNRDPERLALVTQFEIIRLFY